MKQSTYWGTPSSSNSPEIIWIVLNLKVNFRVYSSPPLVQSKINPHHRKQLIVGFVLVLSNVFTRSLVRIYLLPHKPWLSCPLVFSHPNTRSCINSLLCITTLLDSQFRTRQLRSFKSDTAVRTQVQTYLYLSAWSYFELILRIICTPNTLSVTTVSYCLLAEH